MHELLDDFDAWLLNEEPLAEAPEEFARVPERWQNKLFLDRAVHLLKLLLSMSLIKLDHVRGDLTDHGEIGQ